ncbi:MAG TPA: hypothetical protein VGC31_02580 [Paenirhodobacter sp.]
MCTLFNGTGGSYRPPEYRYRPMRDAAARATVFFLRMMAVAVPVVLLSLRCCCLPAVPVWVAVPAVLAAWWLIVFAVCRVTGWGGREQARNVNIESRSLGGNASYSSL